MDKGVKRDNYDVSFFLLFRLISYRLLILKRNYFGLLGAEVRDACGSSGKGEGAPQAFTSKGPAARPLGHGVGIVLIVGRKKMNPIIRVFPHIIQ